jgi:phosphatidylinositol alpha-1,6-mannosyltransferase
LIESVVDIDPTVEIIPPSIDVSAYQNAIETGSSEKTESAPVLVIGRFVDRKNIETVVEAWSRLDMSVRDGRELVIVGNGPNRTALETLVYSDDARFTGWINNSEKRCLLSKADAFVMVPRRDGYDVEGFGIVYIEAQASATPIVGSKHGGVPEAIGGAGIIVDDEEDPDEVAAATEAVLTCEAIRQRCLSAAAERIDRFDIVSVAQQHVAAYKNL